jgi:3-phytase
MKSLLAGTALLALSACAAGGSEVPLATRIANAAPAVAVTARGETAPVGTANADAADDPAIWRNAADPAASLIVGTDKKAGLYVYGLDGKVRDFLDAGRVNNVALTSVRLSNGEQMVVVVASDRSDPVHARLALFRLDTATGKLAALGSVDSGPGEAYGVCLFQPPIADAGDLFQAFSVLKDGTIHQILVREGWVGSIVRTLKLPGQAEGCVVDHRNFALYVGEEDVGIHRFSALRNGPGTGELVAPADGRQLVADVEGLAIADAGGGKAWLIASSQGDNAYAVYSLPDHRPVGRFRVVDGAIGGSEETDGIEVMLGDFGPAFPGGLFIAQDGHNAAAAQNFKLVAWDDIARALGLSN